MPSLLSSISLSRLFTRRGAWRIVWLAMLLLHAPVTYRVLSLAITDESKWSSALLIAATNLFFVLEIIFGWSLHVLTDRRRIIAFLVVIALLHVGVIGHAVPDFESFTDLNVWLAVSIGGVAMIRVHLAKVTILVRFWRMLLFDPVRALRLRSSHSAVAQTAPAYVSRYLRPTRPHRAPPL